jgi:hypothetical protein
MHLTLVRRIPENIWFLNALMLRLQHAIVSGAWMEQLRLAFDIRDKLPMSMSMLDFATLEYGHWHAGSLIAGTWPGVRGVPPCELRDAG